MSDNGFESMPNRYDFGGREVCDILRDEVGERHWPAVAYAMQRKYELREGKKPESDDAAKAHWWSEMRDAAIGLGQDPRSHRSTYEEYKRASLPATPAFTAEKKIPLLDHGYVKLIETWGWGEIEVPEAGIIEAARQSTQGSFRGWAQDKRLLAFLQHNKHSTPFEFAGATIEVQAPIFVFREWHRHRTQSYSEMSARYAPLPAFGYVPTLERLLMRNDGANKQAGTAEGAGVLDEQTAWEFQVTLDESYRIFGEQYSAALKAGVPKELARVGMPVGWYSRMRATANLRNWLQFLTLRLDPAAQWEIRQYAEALLNIMRDEFPRTIELFRPAEAA